MSLTGQLMTVRVAQGGTRARDHQFEIVTATQGRYEFRADNRPDMDGFVRALQNTIQWSLEQLPSARASTLSSDAVLGRDVRPDSCLL